MTHSTATFLVPLHTIQLARCLCTSPTEDSYHHKSAKFTYFNSTFGPWSQLHTASWDTKSGYIHHCRNFWVVSWADFITNAGPASSHNLTEDTSFNNNMKHSQKASRNSFHLITTKIEQTTILDQALKGTVMQGMTGFLGHHLVHQLLACLLAASCWFAKLLTTGSCKIFWTEIWANSRGVLYASNVHCNYRINTHC